MSSLRLRIERQLERNAALFAGAVMIILNVLAVSSVWKPSWTTLGAINAAVAAVLAFLVQSAPRLQSWRLRRGYLRKARRSPRALVPTAAGSTIDKVIGRDTTCERLIQGLHSHPAWPQIVIGGPGTGKTELVVQLTKLLADNGIFPVPITVRDVRGKLDLQALARDKFSDTMDPASLFEDETEEEWRQLRRDNKIVVLSEGFDESLLDARAKRDAIRRAIKQQLSLIITSYPHDRLWQKEVLIVELEPLSDEAVHQYLLHTSDEEQRHLDWLVDTTDAAETPFYLQLIRQLWRIGVIMHVMPTQKNRKDGAGSDDRAELRLKLFEAWLQALILGHFAAGVPLTRTEREASVEQLSVLACIGLQGHQLEVQFDKFEILGRKEPRPTIITKMERRLQELNQGIDMRRAAAWGALLFLVEEREDGIRFPHSVMQSCLASRHLDVTMVEKYRSEARDAPGENFSMPS